MFIKKITKKCAIGQVNSETTCPSLYTNIEDMLLTPNQNKSVQSGTNNVCEITPKYIGQTDRQTEEVIAIYPQLYLQQLKMKLR
jgi:hypothetical protein